MNNFRIVSLVALLAVSGNSFSNNLNVSSESLTTAERLEEFFSNGLAPVFSFVKSTVDTVVESNFVKNVSEITSNVKTDVSHFVGNAKMNLSNFSSDVSVKVAPATEAVTRASINIASVLSSAAVKSGNENWAAVISRNPGRTTAAAALTTATVGYLTYKAYKLVRYGLHGKKTEK